MTDLNLTAIQHWAEHTYAWIGEDQNADNEQLPDFVQRHFTEDVPALVVRIQHLTVELAAAQQMLDVFSEPCPHGVRPKPVNLCGNCSFDRAFGEVSS